MFNRVNIEKIASNLLDPLSFLANLDNNPSHQNSSSFQTQNTHVDEISFPTITDSNQSVFKSTDPSQNSENSTTIQKTTTVQFDFLGGEHQLVCVHDAFLQVSPGRMIAGTLLMTNYRLSFVPSSSAASAISTSSDAESIHSTGRQSLYSSALFGHGQINPLVYSWLHIPLAAIDKIERDNRPHHAFGTTIIITCKDVRQHRIALQNSKNGVNSEVDKVLNAVYCYAFPKDIQHFFAFSHCLSNNNGCNIKKIDAYDIAQEFARQGLQDIDDPESTSHFRYSYMNFDYNLCESYPPVLVMPRMTDSEFETVANFRSERRLPTMCYYCKENGSSMWRSSQPKAGMAGSCWQDEKLLGLISQSCAFKRNADGTVERKKESIDPFLHIVDCRPRSSAIANSLQGAGFESQGNYPNTRLEFYNIPNIHAVRDSYNKLCSIILHTNHAPDLSFSRKIEDTQWVLNIRHIIRASWEAAFLMSKSFPVLVHCSHGWDRTSQVCAIAQIFLDPYFRTQDGFKVLVEKEWMSFGHPFLLRSGGYSCIESEGRNASSKHQQQQEEQFSPIFIQFLDCVFQLVNQYPTCFEYNARYLVAIANEVYSGRFGAFLFNCASERQHSPHASKAADIWTYLHHNKQLFTQAFFSHSTDTAGAGAAGIFLPPIAKVLRNVQFWSDYFNRYSADTLAVPTSVPYDLYRHIADDCGFLLPSVSVAAQLARLETEGNDQQHVTPTATASVVDLAVFATHTSADFWEAAYRRERSERERLEALLAQTRQSSTSSDNDHSSSQASVMNFSGVGVDEIRVESTIGTTCDALVVDL